MSDERWVPILIAMCFISFALGFALALFIGTVIF